MLDVVVSSDTGVAIATCKLEAASIEDLIQKAKCTSIQIAVQRSRNAPNTHPQRIVFARSGQRTKLRGLLELSRWGQQQDDVPGPRWLHRVKKCMNLRINSCLSIPVVAFQHPYCSIAVDTREAHELGDGSLLLRSVHCGHIESAARPRFAGRHHSS